MTRKQTSFHSVIIIIFEFLLLSTNYFDSISLLIGFYFSFSGIILYECTQPTTHDEDELGFILRKIRFLQFPGSFLESKEENILIKRMLSHSPEIRPKAEEVFAVTKRLLDSELKGKKQH